MRILLASLLLFLVAPASADLDGHLLLKMCTERTWSSSRAVSPASPYKAAHDTEFVATRALNHADTYKPAAAAAQRRPFHGCGCTVSPPQAAIVPSLDSVPTAGVFWHQKILC